MNYFKLFGILTGIATSITGQVVQSLADGVLSGSEIVEIIKGAIRGLRMAGVNHQDLDKILVVTTMYEHQQIEFRDGDIMVYAPVELLAKLKIKV